MNNFFGRILEKTKKQLIRNLDLLSGFAALLLVITFCPNSISNDLAKEMYGIGVTIQSIIFSVYFAALAIMISSGDDKFISFLEERGRYTRLIQNFRITLAILLSALVYSLVMYTVTAIFLSVNKLQQSEWFLGFFAFLSVYSLIAIFFASDDVINYALYRSEFLEGEVEEGNNEQDV
ncbi:hypothetical protein [Picosynechococcus sp. PCC 8807]|uniref:hypothetical protein n=1 Tax=Picosynechococcus sp. PCC 8807 TaxID=195248 RepID=UPI0012ED2E0D|nr:hypothetical protein [Picosynechococcus sp. PCC 8807]